MLKEPPSSSLEQPIRIHGPKLDGAGKMRSPPACSDEPPPPLNSDDNATKMIESSSRLASSLDGIDLQAQPKDVDPPMKNRKKLTVASSLISSQGGGYDLRPRPK